VVAKPTRNNRVVHDWLVWLVFEVAIPTRPELWTRPLIHHLELFLSWTNLDSSLNAVGRKRSGSIDIPLLEDALLNCWVTTSEVVEGLDMWLCAIRSKRKADSALVHIHEERVI
jgi:hypothetical protein